MDSNRLKTELTGIQIKNRAFFMSKGFISESDVEDLNCFPITQSNVILFHFKRICQQKSMSENKLQKIFSIVEIFKF